MGYIIRKIKINDVNDVVHIITLGWNQNYKDIIDKKFLDQLKINESSRAIHIQETFDEKWKDSFILEVDGKTVGVARCGTSEYENYDNIPEIIALYIINGYKGYGYGRALFERCITEFKKAGYDKMILNCLEGNKTNYFYIHMGGKKINQIDLKFGDKTYKANVYLFENI